MFVCVISCCPLYVLTFHHEDLCIVLEPSAPFARALCADSSLALQLMPRYVYAVVCVGPNARKSDVLDRKQ